MRRNESLFSPSYVAKGGTTKRQASNYFQKQMKAEDIQRKGLQEYRRI